MKKTLQRTGLAFYGFLARSGIIRQPWVRRAFLTLYSGYKTWIESGPIHRLRDYVQPGSTVIDVGANVGFFTLKFADWVGDQGRVIAIEPDSENFEMLTEKVATARVDQRVALHHAAVSDVAGTVLLQRNELHPGDHRIALGTDGISVQAVTIDDLVAAAGKASVSLVKIDVQGAEMMVIGGAKRTLQEKRPVLFVEVDDGALKRFGSSAQALVAAIEASGYQMHQLVAQGTPAALSHQELVSELQKRSYVDVLFIPV